MASFLKHIENFRAKLEGISRVCVGKNQMLQNLEDSGRDWCVLELNKD